MTGNTLLRAIVAVQDLTITLDLSPHMLSPLDDHASNYIKIDKILMPGPKVTSTL